MKPVRIPLGPGPAAEELVRRADGWPGLLCLRGAWAGGTAIVASHPVRTADALPEQLPVDGPDGFVGGGWFGWLGFDGPSRFAGHDHVLRLVDGHWWFEALWCAERAAVLDERVAAWTDLLRAPAAGSLGAGWTLGEFTGPPAADHLAAVERAVELIRAGELYQVNVCTRLRAPFTGSAAGLFAAAAGQLSPTARMSPARTGRS